MKGLAIVEITSKFNCNILTGSKCMYMEWKKLIFKIPIIKIFQSNNCTVIPNNWKWPKIVQLTFFADKAINRESIFSRNGR